MSEDESDEEKEGAADEGQEMVAKKQKQKRDWNVTLRAFALNAPEKWYIVLGILAQLGLR